MEFQKKILIVDDIQLNRAILGELFYEKYEVLEAENGIEAVEEIKNHGETLAVILLDIVMPVMDGFGVLEAMITHGWVGRIPVVMITSETSAEIMQRGYEMGVVDIISKPFAPNIIRQRIHNIVEQYSYKLHLENLLEQQTLALRAQTKKLRENSAQMIDILSAVIEFKNAESVGHIHNIRTLTKLFMKELSVQHREYELSDDLIELISEAAAMHDIGKVAIPDNILNKAGKLTNEEFEIMKTHSIKGCEILDKLSSVQYLDYFDYCYEICRHHHERWDGKGYPDGLVGDETPIWAQAVSLADVFDALTSKRVYKEAYSTEKAMEMILAGECGVFNPILIQCFLAVLPLLKDGIEFAELNNHQIVNRQSNIVKSKKYFEQDISERTLRLLELERQKYRIMSELSEEILFEYDIKKDQLVFSEKFQELTGKDLVVQEFKATLWERNVLKQEDIGMLFMEVDKISATSPTCKMELRINLDGSKFKWYEVYLYPILDTDDSLEYIGYMGKLIDIENRKQENSKLREAADKDPLTGILNRSAFKKQIAGVFSGNQSITGALCFIDIDDFKSANDNYGHMFGDMVLKEVAGVLEYCAQKDDLVGRIGGDEFVLYIRYFADEADLEHRLMQICKNLYRKFSNYNLSGSVGASRYPKDGSDFEELLHRADQALYLSKRMGKNTYRVYQEENMEQPFHSLQSDVDSYTVG